MRVLLMADPSFARREEAMLRRLEVGLLGEGCRVTRAMPARAAVRSTAAPGGTDSIGELGPTIAYSGADSGLLRPLHLRRFLREAERLARSQGDEPAQPFDIVHVLGDACWDLAIDVAAALDATPVLEVWSAACLARIKRVEAAFARAQEDPSARGVWLAPDAAMLGAVERLGPRWRRELAPWGVHLPASGAERRPHPESAVGVAVVSAGREEKPLAALLEALADLAERAPGLLIFADDEALAGHRSLWRLAEGLGLLERLSMIADTEARRELILRADVLVCPDQAGEHRSIVLDAMAAGLAVAARAEPLNDALIEGRTAVLVQSADRSGFSAALARVVLDPGYARDLGASARRWVQEQRPADGHVRAVLAAYRSAAAPEALRFTASA
ncbi:MAG: glycosyltransferase [Phycisphaerales bacterium]|nr:glycosyltransferase [Phycisphaerales bacterium]